MVNLLKIRKKNMANFLNIFIAISLFISCKNHNDGSLKEKTNKVTANISATPNISKKYQGKFSVRVETEQTTTGMASISYYFKITNNKVVLEKNSYHEPISCQGNYNWKEKNNILELYYADTEENCLSKEPAFYIKKENEQFFIKGIGGEGTFYDWQNLKKE